MSIHLPSCQMLRVAQVPHPPCCWTRPRSSSCSALLDLSEARDKYKRPPIVCQSPNHPSSRLKLILLPWTLTSPCLHFDRQWVYRRRQWVGAPDMHLRNGKTPQKLAKGQDLNCVGLKLPPGKRDGLILSHRVPSASPCKPITAESAEEDGAASREAAPPPPWGSKRLYWVDECPPVLQYNKHVRSGYRAGELCRAGLF